MQLHIVNFLLIKEFSKGIWSIRDFFNFNLCILCQKILDSHVSSTHSAQNLISFLNLKCYLLHAKFIDSFLYSQKHYFKFITILITIYEIGQSIVNEVIFLGNINWWNLLFSILVRTIMKVYISLCFIANVQF